MPRARGARLEDSDPMGKHVGLEEVLRAATIAPRPR